MGCATAEYVGRSPTKTPTFLCLLRLAPMITYSHSRWYLRDTQSHFFGVGNVVSILILLKI